MILRPYQEKAVADLRQAISTARTAMLQMPTGGGKTAIFAEITHLANERDKKVWIVAPRNELVKQASEHLYGKVPHGKITASSTESLAYSVHVASRDTLNRRIKAGKIKNWPDLVFIDEAHLALDSQIMLAENLPPECKIIGVTATPERLDGRGLSELYGSLIEGPSILDLVGMGFLTGVKYFCPPIEGLDKLHRKGTDYDQDELAALLEKRRVFGDAINHYKMYAHNKPALVYCRSVKAAEETALRFQEAGYDFRNIDGKMSYSERKDLIQSLRDGKIHGLTSCELITYGLDVPRVECIIMLRPTLSRSLYSQMIGRGLRTYSDQEKRYVKTECIILDHVNNLIEHGHPFENKPWDFDGTKKRGKKKGIEEAALKLCESCFLHFAGDTCPNCGGENKIKERKKFEEVDGLLVEITGPRKLGDWPVDQKREFVDKIAKCKQDYLDSGGGVESLLEIAGEIKNRPMWVYWELSRGMKVVNIPLLHEIARVKGYQRGWIEREIEKIEREMGRL